MTCWLWHKWGKWEVQAGGKITSANLPDKQIGTYITMVRRCEKCGFIQLKDVET